MPSSPPDRDRVLLSTSALNRRLTCLPTIPLDVVTAGADTNFLDFVLLPWLAATGPTDARAWTELRYSGLIRRKYILETLMRSFAKF